MADNRLFRPGSPRIRNSGIIRPNTPSVTVPGIKIKKYENTIKITGGGDLPPGPFLGTESSNIIGTQSGVGLGVS
mgnify:CR=1 FL=1